MVADIPINNGLKGWVLSNPVQFRQFQSSGVQSPRPVYQMTIQRVLPETT